jgi:hypothetical protein
MTLDQARHRFAHRSWTDTTGLLRVYEAMLRTHGWTDEPTRTPPSVPHTKLALLQRL